MLQGRGRHEDALPARRRLAQQRAIDKALKPVYTGEGIGKEELEEAFDTGYKMYKDGKSLSEIATALAKRYGKEIIDEIVSRLGLK